MTAFAKGDRVYVSSRDAFGHVIGSVTDTLRRRSYTVQFEEDQSWRETFAEADLYDAPPAVIVRPHFQRPVPLPHPFGPGTGGHAA